MSIAPNSYARWRATALGEITERLEVALVFTLAECRAPLRILDVGTGDGTYAIEAARRGASVVAVDPSPAMLAAAKRRASAAGVHIDLGNASVTALPFPDASFDRVMAVTVLCFVEDPVRAIAEMARVTRPGGTIVLGELNRWSLWAAKRRLAARCRGGLWRRAQFWSRGQLARLAEDAGLMVHALRGAVHPPWLGRDQPSKPTPAWPPVTLPKGATLLRAKDATPVAIKTPVASRAAIKPGTAKGKASKKPTAKTAAATRPKPKG